MPNLNSVHLIGNLTREPELKYTPKGTAIASFGIAINRAWKTDDGEKREEVTFVDIEAFARLAEIIGEYCKKGNPIFIEGRLKMDVWDDKETGQKRSKMKVIAESIQLLGGKPAENAPPPQNRTQRPQTRQNAPQGQRQAPPGRAAQGQARQPTDDFYDPSLDQPNEPY